MPENAWKRLVTLLEDRRLEQAAALCASSRREFPDDPRWLYGEAWLALEQGDPRRALAILLEVTRALPDEAGVYRTAARAFLAIDEPTRALAAARFALQLSPDDQSRQVLRKVQTAAAVGADASQDDDDALRPITRELKVVRRRHSTQETSPQKEIPNLDAQLRAMFGESLFGASDLRMHVAPLPGLLQLGRGGLRGPRVARTAGMALALVALALGFWAVRHHVSNQKQKTADTLAELLLHGSWDLLAKLDTSALVEKGVLPGEYGGLVARAQATLFRSYDAAPERRRVAEELLSRAPAQNNLHSLVARLLIRPQAEWPELIDALASADTHGVRDPAAAHLRALAAWRGGQVAKARELFARAERLQPSSLPNLRDMAIFHAETGNRALAANLVSQIQNISPDAAWSRLARAESARSRAARIAELNALGAGLHQLPAVLRSEALVTAAVLAGDSEEGLRHLDLAVAMVHGQRPFVLDYFERLGRAGLIASARHLAAQKAWPKDDPLATSLVAAMERQALARLSEAPRKPDQSKKGAARKRKR